VKFVCDNTVGRLARLLRMAGLDTAYVAENDLQQVISLSREQGRKIVSRNSRFLELTLATDFYHVTSDNDEEQFRTLVVDLQLKLSTDQFLTRCLECNEVLVEIDKQEVKGRVWPYVWQTQDRFHTCPGCGKIYWRATHIKAMSARLTRLLREIEEDAG
jgi:uncharacterized protein with PIN domain